MKVEGGSLGEAENFEMLFKAAPRTGKLKAADSRKTCFRTRQPRPV